MTQFSEGDRCVVCLHWWWNDRTRHGSWHSLVPKAWVDREDEAIGVVCPMHTSLDDLDQMTDASGDAFDAARVES